MGLGFLAKYTNAMELISIALVLGLTPKFRREFARPGLWVMLGVFALAVMLPSLAVAVRRLHDSDKSGWWILLGLTGIGGLVLLIFYLLDGTPGRNRFGADPKGRQL